VVLVTEEQTAGKGRSGRHWACPPGAGLMFSVRLALSGNSGISEIPMARRGWIGAALGLAVCHGFADVAGVHARLKWPNDVLVDGHKCGGILAEMTGDAVIVGAGLNVSLLAAELPRADATSLLLAGAGSVDRNVLLARILDEFSRLLSAWRQAGGTSTPARRSGPRSGSNCPAGPRWPASPSTSTRTAPSSSRT
jgi:BirA family biotin operon repressor/biotin-[acetyl-CoA-carboxylase] ligase